MSARFGALVEDRSHAAGWMITGWVLGGLTIAGNALLAVTTGKPTLILLGVFAGLLFNTAVACAAWRYQRWLGAELAAARRDPLTALPTRAVADHLLRAASSAATDVTVALADVDWLKAFNNNLGHAAGDQYLRAVAQRLAEAVPPGGVLCRHGGDEFLIVAPDTGADTLATAIDTAMTRPAVIAGRRVQPRVSVGIAVSRGGDAWYARACADAALATAKADGGARALVYRLDRDGRPAPDGTRPIVRRRDAAPRRFADLAWLPKPGDEFVPVLWTVGQAHTVHEALRAAGDRWEQAHREAHTSAALPPSVPPPPGHINVRPTAGGYHHIAELAAAEQAKYTQLADQLERLLDGFPDPATGGHHRDEQTPPA
jgi:diguanylate cyclase (GGDEF)-like protein